MSNNILIIDGYTIAYQLIHGITNSKTLDPELDVFCYWKYLMFKKIFSLLKDFNPDRLVIVFDSSNSWRYDYYSEYKGNRAEAKKKYKFNYLEFKACIQEIIKTLQSLFTKFYVLKVDKAEGDDIIAVVTRFHDTSKITIISTDSDFVQLLNKNVKLYNPRQNKYINSICPKNDLNIKILKGDEGDNIPPIKARIGIVTATQIINSGLEPFLENLSACDQQVMLENYNRNKILINFDFIPKDLQRNILEQYQNYKLQPLDGKAIVKMFIKNKIITILNDLNCNIERINKLV